MRIRTLSALIALALPGPVLADSAGLVIAQRSLDAQIAADFLAGQAGAKILADWHQGPGPRGLSGAAEGGQLWYSGKANADRAASSSHLLGTSLWASYSDGAAMTLGASATRFDGRTLFGASGSSHEMSGYGISVGGTHRYGDFVLGTQDSFLWLDSDHALRKTGGADARSKSSGFAQSLGAQAGYVFGGGVAIPYLDVRYDDVSMGRFSESGPLAMSFAKSSTNGWKSGAGLSIDLGGFGFSGVAMRPAIDVHYERWLGAGHLKVKGGAATTLAARPDRDAVSVRPELDFSIGDAVHLRTGYRYSSAKEQGVFLRLAVGGR
jgi:hypothetical protein